MTTPQRISLTIDGQPVEVPAGSTIYDAASQLHGNQSIRDHPIPVLCHFKGMKPVAVCRVCSVEVQYKGAPQPVGKLLPACYALAEDGMQVRTLNASERVKSSVKVLTELLVTDYPNPNAKTAQQGTDELLVLADRLGVTASRFPKAPPKPKAKDETSLVIAVDHQACILCDRCVRGCSEIRDNQVISRMGKGFTARIAFDLNSPMGESSCVSCGECMVSCPTGALTNRVTVQATWERSYEPVRAEELARHPLFQGVSRPFLEFNETAVVRRRFKKGDVICREGESGNTAFLIEKGRVIVSIQSPMKHAKAKKGGNDKGKAGLFGLVRRFTIGLVSDHDDRREESAGGRYISIDAPVSLKVDNPVAELKAGDLFGEMTCMSATPRSATVVAAEDTEVLEMLRNVLYILQRNKVSREWLDKMYRERAMNSHLRSVSIFQALAADEGEFERAVEFLRGPKRAELVRFEPGEPICLQGDTADAFYLIRLGFVKVSQARPGGEEVLTYLGPGNHFGEIGLLSHLPEMTGKVAEPGRRTASCHALDHVDVVRVSGEAFRELLNEFPKVRQQLVEHADKIIEENERSYEKVREVSLGNFLEQGLMGANSLLVLDLESCTRCDECTRACADAHKGVTRLIRDGLRFDKFLVASSCRSCMDPYCMAGCPVDSIHRGKSREIVIEDWCIGCGNCANNCPYGNINMHPFEEYRDDPGRPGKKVAVLQQKATTCDLCTGLYEEPSCVYACPHDAAHRMTGGEFKKLVEGK